MKRKVFLLFLFSGCLSCVGMFARQERMTVPQDTVSDAGALARMYYQKGDSCEKAFNTYEALGWYRKGGELAGEPFFFRKIAQCYMKRGQYAESKDVFNRIPADSLTHTDRRFKYNLHRQLSEADSMLAVGKGILEQYPFDSEVVAGLAASYNTLEMPDTALYYTEQYRLQDSTNIFVNRQRAFAYYQQEDYPRALQAYRELLSLNDQSDYTYYYTGLCYARCDSLSQAYDHLRKAAELSHEENPYILSQLGIITIELGIANEGAEYVEKAIEGLQPDNQLMYSLYSSLSGAYFKLRKYTESIRCLNECLAYDPLSVYTFYKIAGVYGVLKNTKQEKQYYERFVKAVESKEDASDTLLNLLEEAKTRLQAIREEEFMKGEG